MNIFVWRIMIDKIGESDTINYTKRLQMTAAAILGVMAPITVCDVAAGCIGSWPDISKKLVGKMVPFRSLLKPLAMTVNVTYLANYGRPAGEFGLLESECSHLYARNPLLL